MVTLPLFYYEGYRAEYEGERIDIFRGENNRISIMVYQGNEGDVQLSYKEPVLWRFADVVSLGTAVAMFVIFMRKRKLQENLK